jgi:GTPase
VDMGAEDGRDPVEDYRIINNELKMYDPTLLDRPMVVVANKMDLEGADANLLRFKEVYPDVEVFEMITVVGEGTKPLLYRLADILDETPQDIFKKEEETVIFKYEPPKQRFDIVRLDRDIYSVEGAEISRLLEQYDFNLEDEVIQFGIAMRKLGVDMALREAGANHGDTIVLEGFEFFFDEGILDD